MHVPLTSTLFFLVVLLVFYQHVSSNWHATQNSNELECHFELTCRLVFFELVCLISSLVAYLSYAGLPLSIPFSLTFTHAFCFFLHFSSTTQSTCISFIFPSASALSFSMNSQDFIGGSSCWMTSPHWEGAPRRRESSHHGHPSRYGKNSHCVQVFVHKGSSHRSFSSLREKASRRASSYCHGETPCKPSSSHRGKQFSIKCSSLSNGLGAGVQVVLPPLISVSRDSFPFVLDREGRAINVALHIRKIFVELIMPICHLVRDVLDYINIA